LTRQLEGWTGPAAAAYRDSGQHVAALDALCGRPGALRHHRGPGMLVALVRTMVRDLIADFVRCSPCGCGSGLAEEAATFGIATRWS
jgi:hypothetical protein